MTLAIKLFGIIMIVLCTWGMVKPASLISWVLDFWGRSYGIYLAVAIRIALGVLFLLAADQTRYPDVFRFLGYLMIVAAIAITFIGRERLDRFLRWWQQISPVAIRALLVFGLLFGVFVVYGAG